jgi:hypothetical protein
MRSHNTIQRHLLTLGQEAQHAQFDSFCLQASNGTRAAVLLRPLLKSLIDKYIYNPLFAHHIVWRHQQLFIDGTRHYDEYFTGDRWLRIQFQLDQRFNHAVDGLYITVFIDGSPDGNTNFKPIVISLAKRLVSFTGLL